MFELSSRSPEDHARAYCVSIGADPDEVVRGYVKHGASKTWTTAPRWRWYVGVSDAALRRPI